MSYLLTGSFLAGCVLVIAGAVMLSLPLGLIIAGMLAVLIPLLYERGSEK